MNAALASLVLLLAAVASAAPHKDDHDYGRYGTKVGSLSNKQHGVGGVVYVKDERTIFVKDFEYDGAGPDAFFWVRREELSKKKSCQFNFFF